MDYTVLKRENCHAELLLKIDPAVVEQKVQEQLQKIGSRVTIPGFRPGRAPQSLLRRRYGQDILEDLAADLVSGGLGEVIGKEKLRLVGRPRISKTELGEGTASTITVLVEEFPAVSVDDGGYKGISVKVPQTAVLDKDVDEAIRSMLEDEAELLPVSGRAAQDKDLAEVKVVITPADGAARPEATFRLRLGQNELAPDFDRHIVGKKAGDKFTVEHALADAAADAPPAGYAVTLVSLQENRPPELTDEFAKRHEAESAADLKAKVRQRLEAWTAETRQREIRAAVRAELTKRYPIPVPPSFVAGLAEDMMNDAEREMQQYGGKFDRQQMGGAVQAAAEVKARVMLILDAVALKENLAVSEDDLNAHAEQMFASTQLSEADRKRILKRWRGDGTWDNMRFSMKHDKAFNFIVQAADIKSEETTREV